MKKLLLKSEKLILLILLLIVTSISRGQTQTYTTSGSYITPAGVTSVQVEAYGAGGGGGYGGGSNRQGGGGGGGGGYSVNNIVTVVPGTTYSITIGTAGTGSTSSGVNGTTGGTTTGVFGSTVTATGGAGGKAYSTGANGGGGGNGTRNGGNGANGTNGSGSGGGGGAGGSANGGAGAVPTGGLSGGLSGGAGGAGTVSNSSAGTVGANYGGGGGGGTRNSNGANGANGYMIVTYTCPSYALTSTSSPNICGSGTAVVTLTGLAAFLPVGTYTVTYNLSGATTAIGSTATMTVSVAGTGTFTTSTLNVGNNTITVTNLASSYCSSAISSNNTDAVVVAAIPDAVAGTNVTTCSSAGAVNITAGASSANATGGITWTSSGTGSFVNPNSIAACTYTPSAADITAGSVTLTLTAVGTAPCANDTSTKTLTISQPMTAVAGTTINTCSTTGAVNITAGSSATNQTSVLWTSSGTGTLTNPTSLTTCTYTPSVAENTAGSTITLTLTASNAGCANATSTKSLIISKAMTAVAGTNINTCSTSGAVNITAGSSATNQTLATWTSSGTGILTNPTSLTTCTYTPSAAENAAGSTITLTLTATNAGCTNATSTKSLIISRTMTANAGTPVITCSSAGAVNITAGSLATNQTTATWTSSGTGTFANATSLTTCTYTPSAADITAGSVTLTLTASNAGCANVTSNKTLTITGAATAVAGTNINTCSTSGAVNVTTGSSATNYTSVLWSGGTGTFTNPTSLTTCTYTPSAAENLAGSTITLTLTAYGNLPCGNTTSTKSLVISRTMTAVAGTAVSTCSSSGAVNITAGSSATNQTTATWTSSGTGTFANATSLTTCTYTPSAADITAGSVTLTLTASNAGCANVTSTKTLTINAAATAVAGTNINTCSSTGAVNITAGSSATNNTSVLWSGGSGTFTNPTSLTTCTYTPSAAENAAGSTITLTLTSYGNAPCGNATSTKSLIISRAMTVNAGSAFSMCSSTATIAVSTGASATNQSGVTWTSSGTGTFTNPNSLGACSYTPSAADITAGSVTITLTATNNGCSPTASSKILTISTLPTAVAGSAMTTCTSAGAVNITTGSSATSQTSVLWTSSGTGTFANATSLTTCTYNPSAADITAGSVTLTLTAYGSSPCGNATSTKTLTIYVSPTVTGTTPGSRTGTGTVILGATASVGTLNWYAALTGGSSLGTGTSFTTPVISTTTTFYVEAVNGTCSSTPRTAVIATVNSTEIDIQGNAASIVSGDITPSASDWTDFGAVNSTRTFTIRNVGGSLLTVGAITISGANASEFSVTTAPTSVVAIGGTTTFIVTFSPTAVGVRTATISIVNNDSDENPYTFAIQGTGVEQEIDIQGNATSIANGDMIPTTADWTDFSTVAGTRTFTIRNTGNIALTIGTITIGGANAADFTVTTAPAATVGPYGTTTFVVTFAPSAINTRSATISIVNNDNTENPYSFAIQGFGIVPEIDIQGNTTSIVDGDPTPSATDWTDFGSSAGTRTFTIYNNGNIALTVGAITFTGAQASEFTVTTAPSSSVAALSSTTFVVTFTPTALGTRSAVIHIVNNDSNENPYDFNIQGTGVAREIDVQGNAISIASGDMVTSVSDGTDFGSADINFGTVIRTFTIRNTGSLPLTISNPTISGSNASEFTVTTNPSTLTIVAGSSTTFQVTFNPSAVFTRSAQINIVNNDSDENPYYFAIQGTGTLDSDGDGIDNNTDQDDDNDGIIDTVECGTCVSDPFVNGSFEAPVIGTSTYSIEPSANVTGWANSAENFIEIWSTGFNGVPSAAGNQFAELNANVAGNLYQTFCLNGAGGTINWAIKHRGRSGTDVAAVRFGATLATVATVATMTDGNTSWGSYSGTYTIPTGQTTLVLAFTAISSTGGLSYGNFIDDVQIIINQNCVDTDGDGIADLLDVDDDNDGITDIEEAGFKAYSSNTGTMDKTSSSTWVDANLNGINDYIDSMITAGTYSLPDTDGDGVKNYLDLDSDNDSLWDVDEANLTNGDGDINDDGKGDGADSEGDGLLNLFDNSTVFGSTYRAYANDSDSNGIPDYMQLDSNDDGTNDIQTSLYGSFDTNGDGIIDGTGDSDSDGILNIFDTDDILRGSPRDLNRKLYLDFDGRNDYAEDSAILGGLSNATLMAWVDINSAFSSSGVIVGQDKFYIRMNSGKKLEATVNGTTATYTFALNASQWYHVAAVYGGGNLKLYLNGTLVNTTALSGSIAADATKLTIGRYAGSSTNYFKGKIDEVRVFNVALTDAQVQRMVYQEIQNTASQVRGAIVPKDVGSLPFANVLRYYKMDTYKDDIVDDLTTAAVDTGTGMKLYNHKVIAVQQAPMPFTTLRTGTFATAIDDTTNDIRGLDATELDYSIIQVNHNITDTANNVDLGMFVSSGITVKMNNDTKLQNDWYLKLDGKIDLTGKSQFVQSTNSELDVTSSGSLERDQQGQSSKFNYNYWSSPVSSINSTTINHGFTVAGVMKDGTDVNNIQPITWTTGVNGSPTTPMTLSSYWIFKFQNSTNSYANWTSAGQNGALLPGQGYTMKGCGSATADQNYTFVGKPNNGIITSTVGANNLNLCGNPYASAIDADQFIDDNVASIKGTLYIWQHYSSNTSHTTIQYQGGYATYTKTGGTAPVAPAGVSGLGSSSKTPKRFIPVGQGFFVTGSATGGTITFNNGQRLFVKEDSAPNSYTLFRGANPTVASVNPEMNNQQDSFVTEEFMKLRLGYNSTDNLHRQTLLGFMNQHATAGYDNGYDAISLETLTNDMYFINGTDHLNINGDGYFNADNIYPLGVKNATSGNVTFVVDGKENFNNNQEIYIYDNVTSTYNSIKSQNYQVNLPAGTYDTRFSLRFRDAAALGTSENEEPNHGVVVTHSQANSMINIKNELQEVTVKSVMLFNLLGQTVATWKIDNQNQANIQLPVSDLSTGTYIVKVITDGGEITKKILVKK